MGALILLIIVIAVISMFVHKPKPKPRYIRPLRRNEKRKYKKKGQWF